MGTIIEMGKEAVVTSSESETKKVLNFLEWLKERNFREILVDKENIFLPSDAEVVDALSLGSEEEDVYTKQVRLSFSDGQVLSINQIGEMEYNRRQSKVNLVGEYFYRYICDYAQHDSCIAENLDLVLDDYLKQVFCKYSQSSSIKNLEDRLNTGENVFVCFYSNPYITYTYDFYLKKNKESGKLEIELEESEND